jgi:hypothetical protein
VRTFGLIAVCVIVGGLVLAWVVRRTISERVGVALSLVAQLIARFVAIALIFVAAAKIAEHGGWLIAIGALLGLFGLAMAVLSLIPAIALWQVVAHGLPDDRARR